MPRYKTGKFDSRAEAEFSKHLKSLGLKFEYEPDKLVWVPKPRTYTPDFKIWPKGAGPDNWYYVEYKGYFDPKARSKMLHVKAQHPEVDIRFVFHAPNNKISRTSKTRYWQWAEKHGFQWAANELPKEWEKE